MFGVRIFVWVCVVESRTPKYAPATTSGIGISSHLKKYDFVCLWFILLVCSRASFLGFAIHAKEGEKDFDRDLSDEGCTGRPCHQGSGGQVHTKEGKKGSEGNGARRLLPPDQQGKRGERPFGNS